MFKRFFSTSHPLNIIFLLIAAACWWPVFFSGSLPVINNDGSILLAILQQSGFSDLFYTIAYLVIIIITVFTLVSYSSGLLMNISGGFLPAFFFMSAASQVFYLYSAGPAFLTQVFFIAILYNFMNMYQKTTIFSLCFLSGFYAGISFIIYSDSFVYLLICFIAIVIMRVSLLRELVVLLTGFLVPLIITHALLMLAGSERLLIQSFEELFSRTGKHSADIRHLTWLGVIAFMFLWSIVKINVSGILKKIILKRLFELIIISFILVAGLFAYKADTSVITLLLIPFSFILSIFVNSFRKANYGIFIIALILILQVLVLMEF